MSEAERDLSEGVGPARAAGGESLKTSSIRWGVATS